MAAVIDVSNEEQVQAAVDACVAAEGWGVPRVLVQCAGIAPPSKTVGKRGPHSLEKFAQVLNVNTIGTFNVLRLVADKMQVPYCPSTPLFFHYCRSVPLHQSRPTATWPTVVW